MVAYTLNGFTVYAPDYSVPGTVEAVAREVEDSEAAASERFNSSETIYRLWRMNRAEQSGSRERHMTDQSKLLLKRSALADAGFEDYDVLHNGEIVGRIFEAAAAAPLRPWFWCLGYGHLRERWPISGYEAIARPP